jgi:hypothetical protein
MSGIKNYLDRSFGVLRKNTSQSKEAWSIWYLHRLIFSAKDGCCTKATTSDAVLIHARQPAYHACRSICHRIRCRHWRSVDQRSHTSGVGVIRWTPRLPGVSRQHVAQSPPGLCRENTDWLLCIQEQIETDVVWRGYMGSGSIFAHPRGGRISRLGGMEESLGAQYTDRWTRAVSPTQSEPAIST